MSSRGSWVVASTMLLLALAVHGCSGSDGTSREPEHVDGVTFYTLELKAGTPIATPAIMHGSFAIEDGCVVLRSGDLVANPIFVPDAKLSDDHSSLDSGGSTFLLDGSSAASFGGQILDRRQARDLGYDAGGVCTASRFVFVYGEDV